MCFDYMSFFLFFKQKTAYEMRISDWSSDVCSSDLDAPALAERVILINGAHGGLGEAAARACAAAGASVVLLGRRVPKLNRVYDALAAIGPQPAVFPIDLEGAGPAEDRKSTRLNSSH